MMLKRRSLENRSLTCQPVLAVAWLQGYGHRRGIISSPKAVLGRYFCDYSWLQAPAPSNPILLRPPWGSERGEELFCWAVGRGDAVGFRQIPAQPLYPTDCWKRSKSQYQQQG